MPSVTLVESAKLSSDLVVQGVIESIISVNPLYQLLPFDQISGNALKYTRENTLGDVEFLGVGDTILAKNPATFTQETASLTTLIGDAEVDHFIQTTRSNQNDQKGVQVASKAKNIGRKYQDTMINGDITAVTDSFDGFIRLIPAGQQVATATDGENISFAILDELLDLVTAKDGQVDFLMMSKRTIRAYFALLRGLGGAGIGEVVTLPNGTQQAAYRGVPIFPNDWIPTNQVQGLSGANATTVFAGAFDDGSRTNGVVGLTSEVNSGIFVTEVGESETKNEIITRVRFYCGLALFTQRALASASGILN